MIRFNIDKYVVNGKGYTLYSYATASRSGLNLDLTRVDLYAQVYVTASTWKNSFDISIKGVQVYRNTTNQTQTGSAYTASLIIPQPVLDQDAMAEDNIQSIRLRKITHIEFREKEPADKYIDFPDI